MTPKLDIPITLELAQSAYPQTEYERKKSILASLKDQSPIAPSGDVV